MHESLGLAVTLDLAEAGAVGETASIALYTIVRELVEQAIRRGPPQTIGVRVSRRGDGALVAVVSDDAEPERRRRSIEAIEERARQLHGSVSVRALERRQRDQRHPAGAHRLPLSPPPPAAPTMLYDRNGV